MRTATAQRRQATVGLTARDFGEHGECSERSVRRRLSQPIPA